MSKTEKRIFRLLALVFLACLVFLYGSAFRNRLQNMAIRDEAVSAMEEGRYEQAVELLEPLGDWRDAPQIIEEARRAAYPFEGVCPKCGYGLEEE